MKKSYLLSFLLLMIFSGLTQKAIASHVPGGHIKYTCTGPNQYNVTLNLYRDCSSSAITATNLTIQVRCGTSSFNVTLPRTGGPTEISQLCPVQMSQSACNGGSLPGTEMITFSGNVTLPYACNSWALSYNLCCRNAAVNVTNATSNNFYVETTINNTLPNPPCNDSPYITSQPVPYFCVGQQASFNFGVVDPEGDSLAFELVEAKFSAVGNVNYAAGYSGAVPIQGLVFNSSTGNVNFTPNQVGNFVVVLLIKEYDSNGNLRSSIRHDTQFVITNCTNSAPNPPATYSSWSGTAAPASPYIIDMCPGDNFCFSVTFNDPNPLDIITLTSNVTSVLPGATFTTTQPNPITGMHNPATATVCYTVPSGAAINQNYSFIITAEDNGCPVKGYTIYPVTVRVISGTDAGPDETTCNGQGVQLTATGGSTFNWSVLSGPPMQVGTNFSCNPCQSPVASPTSTTTYLLSSNLSSNCIFTDTVTVFIVPAFPLNITPANPTVCSGQSVQLNANASDPSFQPYSYSWTPAAGLSDPLIANPIATPIQTTTYIVEVTGNNGCIMFDTANVIVNGIAPTVTVSADTNICFGQSVQLTSSAVLQPMQCGLNTIGCTGSTVQATIGTNTTNSDFYFPFYVSSSPTYQYALRHQYIYTVAELQAAGLTSGGAITSVAFDMATANGTPFTNFTVKMGCTSMGDFPNTTYINGLAEVYFQSTHLTPTGVPGWHIINLQTPYNWDGVSNLMVEFCSNGAIPLLNPEKVNYTSTTPIYKSIYNFSDDGGCGRSTGSRSYFRPNLRFNMCQPNMSPSYSWTPITWLSDPAIPNPVATPQASTTYTINVTDNITGCIGSNQVVINVGDNYELTTSPDIAICYGNNTQISTTPDLPGNYTYNWSPPAGLSSPNNSSSNASPGTSTEYIVTVSNGYCVKNDTVNVDVYGSPVGATISQDTVCPGTQVQLDVTTYPQACGLSFSGCNGTEYEEEFGTGTLSSSTYSPFYGTYQHSKYQFLYRAQDMIATGLSAGTIKSISFFVTTKNTSTPLPNFNVRMGCTNATTLSTSNGWEPVAGTVFSSSTFITQLGWNEIVFTTPYEWDGISNIVIETCHEGSSTFGADNVQYSSLAGYNATMRAYNNVGPGCDLNPSFTYAVYPNIKFKMCNNSLPANATFAWSPTAGISDPTIQNPLATVNGNVTYTVS
ncbi:MAG: hypothetical protein M3Q58_12510, partial [Bacteroidota bacterium]|nr:hypothetical protein [Bacteroidota bacterium]